MWFVSFQSDQIANNLQLYIDTHVEPWSFGSRWMILGCLFDNSIGLPWRIFLVRSPRWFFLVMRIYSDIVDGVPPRHVFFSTSPNVLQCFVGMWDEVIPIWYGIVGEILLFPQDFGWWNSSNSPQWSICISSSWSQSHVWWVSMLAFIFVCREAVFKLNYRTWWVSCLGGLDRKVCSLRLNCHKKIVIHIYAQTPPEWFLEWVKLSKWLINRFSCPGNISHT